MKEIICCFNRFEFALPQEAIDDIARPGPNDSAVELWVTKLSIDLTPTLLREELKEYGAWDAAELSNHAENIQRIIWIAAHNAKEDECYGKI